MKKLLILVIVLIGCASQSKINIVDGSITSNSVTLKTEDIISSCKEECTNHIVSSNEWCDCMYKCSDEVFVENKVSIGNMKMRVYIHECSSKNN